MADNSGAERNSPVQHWAARRKMVLSWAVIFLTSLVVWGTWLAQKRGFSALWGKWPAPQEGPGWYRLVEFSFVVLALVGLVVLWKAPQWQVGQVKGLNRKERFDRENEARKTLATILGGVALLAGSFFTWRNINVAQESLKVSQKSAATSQKALSVSQEGQITDRFTKAIEQLDT